MFYSVILLLGSIAAAQAGIVGYPGLFSYPSLATTYRTQYHTQATHNPVVTYAAAPAVAAPAYYAAAVAAPAVYQSYAPAYPALANQYHSQNHLGEASYGYSFPGQTHSAVRDHAGGVTGSYSYVDADGKPVHVNYRADSANGFQVSSNNLPVAPKVDLVQPENTLQGPEPVDFTPEVKAAREEHFKALEEAKTRAGSSEEAAETSSRKKRSIAYALPAVGYPYAAPAYYGGHLAYPSFYSALGYAAAPVVPAPAYVTKIVEPLKPIEGKILNYTFTAGNAPATTADASAEKKDA